MDAFEPGDKVRLKCGGPEMTVLVRAPGLSERYACLWFDGPKMERGVFPAEDLQLADFFDTFH